MPLCYVCWQVSQDTTRIVFQVNITHATLLSMFRVTIPQLGHTIIITSGSIYLVQILAMGYLLWLLPVIVAPTMHILH